jgi:hypothetical protein
VGTLRWLHIRKSGQMTLNNPSYAASIEMVMNNNNVHENPQYLELAAPILPASEPAHNPVSASLLLKRTFRVIAALSSAHCHAA